MAIRDRIRELRRVRARELAPHPKNWRQHPQNQRAALSALLAEVGYADALVAYETADGLVLIDGHLRAETTPDELVPVLVLDVTAAEAEKLLLSLDPLAALATADQGAIAALAAGVTTESDDLAAFFRQVAAGGEAATETVDDAADRQEAAEIEEEFSVLIRCANEPDQKAVLAELDRHGLDTRALCVGFPKVEVKAAEPAAAIAATGRSIAREIKVARTPRVRQMEGIFDVPPAKRAKQTWSIDFVLDRPWSIGLIVGPSGCGKSTIARELFGDRLVSGWEWPAEKSLLDGFPEGLSIQEITGLLSSVGFSSPPSWVKPFAVLSNGEQFRVNLARTLAELPDLAVVDEFTSVVDRTVAQVGSAAVAKAVRGSGRRFVAVACHYDIEEWLQPDWKYEPASGTFAWRCLRRRPELHVRIRRALSAEWRLFGHHHYLSTKIHPAARCFVAEIERQPAAFVAVLHNPHWNGGWYREHRVVTLPDFQGVGLGNAVSEFVAGLFVATGKQYRSTTSHPAMIRHRLRSPLWRMIRRPSFVTGSGRHKINAQRSAYRLTAAFQYLGTARSGEAAALGIG